MKHLYLLISFITLFALTFADDNVTPKLAPNAKILEKIKKLKPNEACLLPGPTVLGEVTDNTISGVENINKFGPEGRDFSIKMVWMPDRKRAFFCGANHGAPHRLNDAWEYDLASNTWVLLYNPDYNDSRQSRSPEGVAKSKDFIVLKDGFVQTKKGSPVHVAHTWWGLDYEPNLKKVFWYCTWPGGMKLQTKLFGFDENDLYQGPPLWTFEPETKKWAPYKTEKPWGKEYVAGASLVYVSDLKSLVLQNNQFSHVLDAAAGKWHLIDNKEGDGIPIETVVYYDPKRKMLISHKGDAPDKDDPTKMSNGKPLQKYKTRIAKLNGQEIGPWEVVYEGFDAPVGHDARSTLHYDPKSTEGLTYVNATNEIWSFNPDEKKWTKQEPTGDKIDPKEKTARLVSYLDLEHNVYVVIGQKWVWCYRYK